MPSPDNTTHRIAALEAEPSAGLPFSLLVIVGAQVSTYPLPLEGHVLIGRSKTADVRIDHASVSREHAVVAVGPDGMRLEDLRSSNGTHLLGRRLAPDEAVQLPVGAVIDLGEVLLVVQHRRLEMGLVRAVSLAFFEERRVQLRGEPGASSFRLAVSSSANPAALEVLVASRLEEGELCTIAAPGMVDVLHRRGAAGESRLAAELLALLTARNISAEVLAEAQGRGSVEPASSGSARPTLGELPWIVQDPATQTVFSMLARVAQSDISVILLGETGAGKEVCAEFLSRASRRHDKRLVRLNCAGLSETLLESELFGHEQGAFTGAVRKHIGLLEAADGGTVFLDEVGDMPLSVQAKLLRVLEAKEVRRLGASQTRTIDIRIVSATHRDLRELVTQGLFREDLFYRLHGVTVLVPPLRERPLDIVPLAEYFLRNVSKAAAFAPRLSERSKEWLIAQRWPGNVRQLKNVIERAALLVDGAHIEVRHLELDGDGLSAPPRASVGLREEVRELERERIEWALTQSQGSQRGAARVLGISRGALLRRLDQLGIRSERD